jgi:hypothetical protein
MHQGLDPKALAWGHSKEDSSSPSLPHSHSLCQGFSPWVAAHSSRTFLSWKQPITVMVLNVGNMNLRQDIYELLNIKISNERQWEQNAVLDWEAAHEEKLNTNSGPEGD